MPHADSTSGSSTRQHHVVLPWAALNLRRLPMSRLALLGGALLVLATACATTTTTSTSTTHHGSPRRPTANGREEFERMILADEEGRIPPGALVRALDHVKRLRALNAVGEAAGIGRNSWTWPGPGNIGGRVTPNLVPPTHPNQIWIHN